uniref:Uncharacterized protein n=1 Tax=Arundo donax TaxID=35708 RepID=A0A0A9GKF6_ARUDO
MANSCTGTGKTFLLVMWSRSRRTSSSPLIYCCCHRAMRMVSATLRR